MRFGGPALVLVIVGCAAATAPMSPRTAAAVAGASTGSCRVACGTGTWCDHETGTCVGTSPSPTRTSDRAAPLEAATYHEGTLPFVCRTADGTEDEIVASDRTAATHACEALGGEPCTCERPRAPD